MSKFGFNKAQTAFGKATKQAAIIMMRETKIYFGKAFDSEQLGNDKWQEVKRRTPGSKFNKRQVVTGINQPTGKRFIVDQGRDFATRKILKGTTGRLRYKTVKADSAITGNGRVSTMINPVPYASYINEGTTYMPARPFMKQTDALTTLQLKILETETGKIWQVG
jgi:hypothetical protein